MAKEKINLLMIEWYNAQDLKAIKEASVNTCLNLVSFADIFTIKYDKKKIFQRYWMQIKHFSFKKWRIYLNFIINNFFRRSYVYSQDNVRKLNVMSLSFEDYVRIIRKNKIKGIILHREDPWLNNIILFSKRLGLKIIIMNKEHIYDFQEAASKFARKLPFRCDLMLIGGELGKRFWSKSKYADPTKIKVTGVPRFDNYFKKQSVTRERFCRLVGLDPKKKIIFFPSFNNHCCQRQFFVTKNHLDKLYKPSDLEHAWPMGMYYDYDISYYKEEVVKTLYRIAEENPDLQVLIKLHPDMHPNEEHCVKHELLAVKRTLKNFVCVTSYDARIDPRDALYHSDIIVGHASTMLLEGIMMEKSLIQPMWGKAKKVFHLPLHEYGCCEFAKSPAELKKKILSILHTKNEFKKYETGRKKIIEKYFYKLDGRSSERVIKEIERLF